MTQPNTSAGQILPFPGPLSRKEMALKALPGKSIKRWTASAKQSVLEAIRVEAITGTPPATAMNRVCRSW